MSIIAGVYGFAVGSVREEFVRELAGLISREPGGAIREFGDSRTRLFKLEIPAFEGTGEHFDDHGGVSVMSGETLSRKRVDDPDRDRDLAEIHAELEAGKTDLLASCRGTFCAVSAQKGSLTLVADKLGVRQMFYWIGSEFVVFASALRIIEELSFVPKRLSLRGTVEIAALGYPLGDRTAFEDVCAMRAGEVIQFRDGKALKSKYWKWDGISGSEQSESELLDDLYRRFRTAIECRLQGDSSAIAFLSGGLDSRCIVAELCALGCRPHTFNFARPKTQDLVLGALFAGKAKTLHTEVSKASGDHVPDYSGKIADAWTASRYRSEFPVERENVAWSGEGGSVALGHVQFPRCIADAMRSGDIDLAITLFLKSEGVYLSPKLFKRGIVDDPLRLVRDGIREEIAQFSGGDPARHFHLFLMQNEQRRKLHTHLENIDRHRIEFQVPFFDADVLEAIVAAPVDLCIGHRLYVNWLTRFASYVSEVPWQSYPGHTPCPLPAGEELSYQWDESYLNAEQRALNSRKLKEEARMLFRDEYFPHQFLSRSNLRLAYLIHRTRLRDYSYLIETARLFQNFHRKCR